jgi:signal transduction histidine kinase
VFRWLLFGILLIVNLALALTMTAWSRHLADTSASRARAIAELEAVNAELERAVAENAALRDRLVARAREAGVDDERQRLAREIHDGIAQSLAGVVTQLQAEIAVTGPGGRTGAALALAREALTDARRSVLDLGPVQLSGSDLPTALRAETEMWSRRSGVRADVRVVGEEVALHQEVEATVLRVVQEALANCRKHAAARRVGVTLSYDPDEIMVDVRDDGRGFDPGRVAGPGTFGLRGMRQRAERLAGALEIESGSGVGTAVSLRLPALERGAA